MSEESIKNIKSSLVAQLNKVEVEMDKVGSETHPEAPKETAEIGTYCWHLQIQETRLALKESLIASREKIKESIIRIKQGIYGICDKCGNKIEEARLKIMPTTTLCVGCK